MYNPDENICYLHSVTATWKKMESFVEFTPQQREDTGLSFHPSASVLKKELRKVSKLLNVL